MRKIFRFFHLDSRRRYFLAVSILLLCVIRIWLRFGSFKKVLAFVERFARAGQNQDIIDERIMNDIIWSIETGSRHFPGTRHCLTRALATKLLMERNGYPVDLCIGVHHSTAGKLEAHAWVERMGKVIIGELDMLSSYKTLPPLEGIRS